MAFQYENINIVTRKEKHTIINPSFNQEDNQTCSSVHFFFFFFGNKFPIQARGGNINT